MTKILFEALERRALLRGEMDTSFGTGGITTTDFSVNGESVSRVAAGPDGKIYASGELDGAYFVARYTSTGQLDTSFNAGAGYVKLGFDNYSDITALAVSPAGEIYLGGSKSRPGGSVACVVAITPAGTLDTAFSGDGIWTGTWSEIQYPAVNNLVYYNGGLYAQVGDQQTLGVAKFTSAGELDPTFGTAGTGCTLRHIDESVYWGDMSLVPAVGAAPQLVMVMGVSLGSYVSKYDLSGMPVAGFSSSLLPIYSGGPVAADTSGHIYFGTHIQSQAAIARLTATGEIDKTFCPTGAFGGGFYTVTDPAVWSISSLEVLPISGSTRSQIFFTALTNTGSQATLISDAGVPNLGYGDYGAVTLPTTGVVDSVRQADGKIVLAAGRSLSTGVHDTQVLRLNAPPQPVQADGYVFDDVNGDGLQNDTSTRSAFYGNTVYLDLNNNGLFDSVNEPYDYLDTAKFSFSNLAPNTTYTARLYIGMAGVTQTSPANNAGVTFTTSGPFNTIGRFGLKYPPASHTVTGLIYNDLNGNGAQDSGEAGLSGRSILVDDNNNGVLDGGESTITTGAGGTFSATLLAGNHYLRQIAYSGYHNTGQSQTTAVSGSTFATNALIRVPTDTQSNTLRFGQRVNAVLRGFTYNDANGNGTQDAGEANITTGGFIYADINQNGTYDAGDIHDIPTSSGYSAMELPPGNYVIRQSVDSGWSATTSGGQIFVGPTSDLLAITFGRRQTPVTPGPTLSLSGTVYNDTNKNYKRDAGEPGMNLVRVYVDENNNSVVDTNEWATYTNADGAFAFPAIPATGRNATVRVVLPSGYTLKYPSSNGGYVVPLTAKSNVTTLNFGLVPGTVVPPTATPVSVSGLVYGDANKSNTKDGTETGIANVTVFADLDNDGVPDAGEAKAVTGSTGAYTLSVPAANGAVGSATIRVVLPGGYTQQTPTTNYTVSVVPAATYTGRDFGLYKPVVTPPTNTASISGLAFNDTNKNGVYDTGDSVAGGKTVWLDLDDDGVKDANETSVVTDSAGKFSFKNLAAGRYHVRRVFPTGYLESTPARYITLTNGQAATDVRIGSKVK